MDAHNLAQSGRHNHPGAKPRGRYDDVPARPLNPQNVVMHTGEQPPVAYAQRVTREVVALVLTVAGAICACVGAFMVSTEAGFVGLGVMLVLLGYLIGSD